MGNIRGRAGLMDTRANYRRVTFQALLLLSKKKRLRTLQDTLRDAKVRRSNQKAKWLADNFALVQRLGGLKAARSAAMAAQGTEGKIAFMRQFSGIGEKYGRNIGMDVYHP